jgi:hypothetical protein
MITPTSKHLFSNRHWLVGKTRSPVVLGRIASKKRSKHPTRLWPRASVANYAPTLGFSDREDYDNSGYS